MQKKQLSFKNRRTPTPINWIKTRMYYGLKTTTSKSICRRRTEDNRHGREITALSSGTMVTHHRLGRRRTAETVTRGSHNSSSRHKTFGRQTHKTRFQIKSRPSKLCGNPHHHQTTNNKTCGTSKERGKEWDSKRNGRTTTTT